MGSNRVDFRTLLDHVSDMVTLSDRDGRITYANAATERVCGYPPDEFVRLPPFESIHPEDRPRCEATLRRLCAEPGLKLDLEHRIRHASGEWRWVEVRFESLFEDPAVGGILATVRDTTERRDTEEAMRKSEARFRTLAATAPALIWQNDANGENQFVNQRFLDYTGKSEEEIEGLQWHKLVHPDHAEAYIESYMKAVRDQSAWHNRNLIRRHDGEWQWFDNFAQPLLDPNGRYLGHVGVTTNINATVEAEAHRRESEERQAFLLKLSDTLRPLANPVAIQRAAAHTLGEYLCADRAYYVNIDEARQVAHVEQEYRRGEAPSLIGEYTFAAFESALKLVRGGSMALFEDTETAPAVDPSDLPVYRTLGLHAFLDAPLIKHGEVVCAMCVVSAQPRRWTETEITLVEETADRTWSAIERARAEAALHEIHAERDRQANIYETTLSTISDFAYIFDRNGCFTFVNQPLLDLWGMSLKEAVGRTFHELPYPEEQATMLQRQIRQVIETGDSVKNETEYKNPEGHVGYYEYIFNPVFDADGAVETVVGSTHDLTERKRAEEQRDHLKRREAAMRAEIAERERISRELHDRVAHSMGVAHQSLELFNALSKTNPERANERLELAREHTLVSLEQTRNLAIELRRSVADEISGGLEAAVRKLLQTTVSDDVRVDITFSGEEYALMREVGAQVYLIVREALTNVVKHSNCENIHMDIEIRPSEVLALISDDGDGFDEQRTSKTSKNVLQSGIGLGSMHERAQMLGGKLTLKTKPGCGTEIKLHIPL